MIRAGFTAGFAPDYAGRPLLPLDAEKEAALTPADLPAPVVSGNADQSVPVKPYRYGTSPTWARLAILRLASR